MTGRSLYSTSLVNVTMVEYSLITHKLNIKLDRGLMVFVETINIIVPTNIKTRQELLYVIT